MKEFTFYSPVELQEIKQAIKDCVPPSEYASIHAEKYNRTKTAVSLKMRQVMSEIVKSEDADKSKYTEEQVKLLKHAIFRGDSPKDIVDRYVEKWNRRKPGLTSKVFALKKEIASGSEDKKEAKVVIKEPVKEEIVVEKSENGVQLPKGFKFEGTPKKVILYSDHFRVYF